MSLFVGTSNNAVETIAGNTMSRTKLQSILDEIFPKKIGELQFVSTFSDSVPGMSLAGNTWTLTDESQFDGWIYPDGRTVKCTVSQLQSACLEYAGNSSATTFTLPNLTNAFFKGDASNGLKNVAAQVNQIPEHTHSVTTTSGFDSQITILSGFVFCAAGNYGAITRTATYKTKKNNIPYVVPAIHSGENKTISNPTIKFPVPLTFKLKFKDFKAIVGNTSTNDAKYASDNTNLPASGEFLPGNNLLPVMMWIGH